MRVLRTLMLFCVLRFAFDAGSELQAQNVKPPTSNRLQVYLVTIGSGGAIWEKFGHNALWFTDSAGIDESYSWGTFDFKSPGFVWRFVTLDTRYWVERWPPASVLFDFFGNQYDRTIIVQRLNFTDEQARFALNAARVNALEANKYYRYDYFLDNCSTRVRDAIDAATNGALKRGTSATVPRSFRSESVRLTDDMGLAQFGITTALGRRADAPLTLWEDAFVPMRLRDIVRDVKVTVNGKEEPLVLSESTIHTTKTREERADVPSFWTIPLIIGLALAVELTLFGILGLKSKGLNLAFHMEAAVISAVSGLLGAAILFAWLFTKHTFWALNENLLIVNPLSIWLAPLAVLSATRERWRRPAAILGAIIAACSAVALMLKGLPDSQQNIAVIALMLPLNFAIAFGLWTRSNPGVSASSDVSA